MPAHLPVIAVFAWWFPVMAVAAIVITRAPRAYTWLATAFMVSWFADAIALRTGEAFWVSRVYPVSQAALVAAVFLSRKEATGVLAFLVCAGLAGVFLEPQGPELFTHLVAWLTAAAIASDEAPQPLRRALVTYFGLGSLLWVWYVLAPGWSSWGAYQASRVLGIGLFAYACWKPTPELRLT